jgi:hypothetical protein
MSIMQVEGFDSQEFGYPGQVSRVSSADDLISVINSAGATAQVGTVVVAADDGKVDEYTVLINGYAAVPTMPGSPSKANLAAAIEAAIQSAPLAGAYVDADADTTDKVTITALQPGTDGAFTLAAASGSKLTVTAAATAAADGDTIQGGLLVGSFSIAEDGTPIGGLPKAARLEVQKESFKVKYNANDRVSIEVEVDGATYAIDVTPASDTDTLGAALKTALNGKLPANTVDVEYTAASDILDIVAEDAGRSFKLTVATVAADTLTVQSGGNTGARLTDINNVLRGVAVAPPNHKEWTYGDRQGMQVKRKRTMFVRFNGSAPSLGAPLYISTGADAGEIYTAGGAGKVRINPEYAWFIRSRGDIAEIGLNFPPPR